METELSKNLYCIVMRNGIELWIEEYKVTKLQTILENISSNKFIFFENRTINTSDLSGIFTAQDMEDLKRRRNGQWECTQGKWHDRGERCECTPRAEIERAKAKQALIDSCTICDTKGFILVKNEAYPTGAYRNCSCWAHLAEK